MSKKTNPVIQSWAENAAKWIDLIENDKIESRKLVTNAAILKTVLEHNPQKVLDVGCGEGWLVDTLSHRNIQCVGLDAVSAFIERAQKKRKGVFLHLSYQQICEGAFVEGAPFDLICMNFSLFENKKSKRLLSHLKKWLKKEGSMVIQTVHPIEVCENEPYKSGWRKDSWRGLEEEFRTAYKWYFRTFENWSVLFQSVQLELISIQEPVHPKTERPLSVIFVLRKSRS